MHLPHSRFVYITKIKKNLDIKFSVHDASPEQPSLYRYAQNRKINGNSHQKVVQSLII